MAADSRQRQGAIEWATRGVEAVRAGDFASGRNHLQQAIRADKRNPYYRFDLALAQQALGEIEAAIVELCAAIRLKPEFDDASRRLAMLLERYQLPNPAILDPFALRSAMAAPNADHQALAEAGLTLAMQTGSLAAAMSGLTARGPLAVAREMLAKRTDEPLRDDLVLMALSHGANKSFALERLLTALRRVVLLELAHERFEDKTLQAFTLALVTQCLANEHVWAETSEESDRVALLLAGRPSLKPDDFEVSRSVLLPALYRPLSVVLPAGLKDPAFETLRPRALRDLIKARLETEAAESEAAARFTSGSRAGDAITQRVIGQYEGSPYPRFSSLTLPRPGSLLPFLKRIFTPDPISFVDGDFDVLIAGCGTGRHAIQSALGYGPRANVRAIDLSARSLAFAGAVAKRFGVGNLTFERADLLALDPKARAFDVIEAVGVLHHLADPFAGWLTLLACLKPHGLMLLGLYSAASRKVLGALRVEPEFPGAGCTDQAARAYRQLLLARGPEQPGGDLVISKDAYTLSEFRDLALHEHEKPISLPEIAAFLTKHKLVFQGFLLPGETLATFRKRFPEAGAERDLARWATYETDNPRLFDGMYRFWCRRG